MQNLIVYLRIDFISLLIANELSSQIDTADIGDIALFLHRDSKE